MAARKRATVRAAVLPARGGMPALGRLAPSGRSVALGLALSLLAVAAYAVARETSVFSVTRLEIAGGGPRVQSEVRAALAPELGRSLLRVNGDELDRRLASIPDVLSIRHDRAFPHTLRIVVVPERAVMLLRRGEEGWVVSARGRVLRRVGNTRVSSLPRVWVPHDAEVEVGSILAPRNGGLAAAALAPLAAGRFPAHVLFVRADAQGLTLVLRSRFEVRLGDAGDLRLKYAIARRLLLTLGLDGVSGYLDVSVPERPVFGPFNPQVGG